MEGDHLRVVSGFLKSMIHLICVGTDLIPLVLWRKDNISGGCHEMETLSTLLALYDGNLFFFMVKCSAIIMRSIFSQILTKDTL